MQHCMRGLFCGAILVLGLLLAGPSAPLSAKEEPGGHAKSEAKGGHHDTHGPTRPTGIMDIVGDTALWTVVIFVLLLLILRKMAWGPILEGLHKREESIRLSIEEAKNLRAENARATAEFQSKLDAAYAEIPRLMEEARKDAAHLREQMKTEATAEITKERQRLLREIDTAKDQALQDIWNQSAQLATLISSKAIGNTLSVDDHRRLVDEVVQDLRTRTPRS